MFIKMPKHTIDGYRAVNDGLIVKRGEYWVTPLGKYIKLGNAVRFIKKAGLLNKSLEKIWRGDGTQTNDYC